MKKLIVYIFTIYFLGFSHAVFAEGCQNTCKIEDSSSPALEQYLNNVSKIVNNVSKGIGGAERDTSTLGKVENQVLASMSQMINFSGFFSSFDFYVAVPITQEVPYPVKRDHERLKKETERLVRLTQTVTRRGYGDVRLSKDEACSGVTDGCILEGSARYILTSLAANNKKIVDMYRLSIVDNAHTVQQDYILVKDNFESELQEYYNKDTLTDCSQCEGAFMDRIQESIDKISNLNVGGSEGIRKWKEAWAQLTGAIGQSARTQEEDRILRDYLSTQGISGDAAEVVTDNLERYNSGGLSTSNPLFNSANYTFSNAEETVDSFVEGALENYLDTDQEKIPIVVINKTANNVETTQTIENTIAKIYEKQLPFAAVQDTGTQKVVNKIIRMHYSLADSINILDPTVKISEKVCDSQGQGDGKCSYR